MDHKQNLLDQEAEALAELRRVAPGLIQRYLEIRAGIEGIERAQAGDEYAGFKKPLPAIEHYLNKHERAAPKRTIAKEIADGGYTLDETLDQQARRKRVYDALNFYSGPDGPGTHVIRNGRFGRRDWPDSKFEQEGDDPVTEGL